MSEFPVKFKSEDRERFIHLATTSYLDMGAAQNQDSGGGSAGVHLICNMSGNLL